MSALNDNQARSIRVSCQYIDRLLGQIEAILESAVSGAAFPQYIPDVSSAGSRTLREHITLIRAQLRRVLEEQGIEPPPPSIPAGRAVRANLYVIGIVAEEMKPTYMKGYGEMSAETAAELHGIAEELRGLVARALAADLASSEGPELPRATPRIAVQTDELE